MKKNCLVSRVRLALKKAFYRFTEQRLNSLRFSNVIRKKLRLKPIIPYIEVHLVDHCNLNCKGCSHFSPFADRVFADISQYIKDIKQLSRLASNIRKIRLLGGEPLLHPNITVFISTTRKYFPDADIQIVSNGILLSTMKEKFWQNCQQAKISVELNIAPPFYKKQETWTKMIKDRRLRVYVGKKMDFIDFIDVKGSSEEKENFKRCRKRFPSFPMLKEGKIYNCFIPATVHYFNKKYGTKIPNAEYINIHDSHVDGWDILKQINTSTQACKYCTGGWKELPRHPWTQEQ